MASTTQFRATGAVVTDTVRLLDGRTTPSSGDLVRAARAGSEQGWAALVDRHSGMLWAVARAHRLSDADAADVVQTTWMRLTEHIADLREPECVPGWLAATARRECLRRLRRRELPSDSLDTVDRQDPGPGPEDTVLRRDAHARLEVAMRRLPDRDRQLLRLLMASPAPTYAEIAAALDMPMGSIGPTRARALTRLRGELAAVGFAGPVEG